MKILKEEAFAVRVCGREKSTECQPMNCFFELQVSRDNATERPLKSERPGTGEAMLYLQIGKKTNDSVKETTTVM